MTKLPVWATVTEAYRSIWANRRLLLRFAAVPLVLCVVITPLAVNLGYAIPGLRESWTGLGYLLFCYFLGLAALVPFVVQCYRLLLLGPAAVSGDGPYRVGSESLNMLIPFAVSFILAVSAFFFVPLYVLEMAFNRPYAYYGIVFGFLLAGAYLVARITFLFAFISLKRPWNLVDRWRETRGNAWRIVLVLAVALCPLVVPELLWALFSSNGDIGEIRIADSMNAQSEATTAGPHWPSLLFLGQLVAGGAWKMIFEALWAAVTVTAFATLTGFPAKGLRLPEADQVATAPQHR